MRCLWMFVTAVCFLFLLKLKWPKNKNIYNFVSLIVLKFVGVSSKHLRIFLESLRESSEIFGNFRKFTENVRERSSGLRNNFGKSSEIFGKWSERKCKLPYDVKLRQSFLANQKAINAMVGAENLLKLYNPILCKLSRQWRFTGKSGVMLFFLFLDITGKCM